MRQRRSALGSRQTTPSLPSGALVVSYVITFPFWYIIVFSMHGPARDQFITSHHGCSCSRTERPPQPWLPGNLTVRRAAGHTVGNREDSMPRLYAFKRSTFTLPQRSTPACVRHEVRWRWISWCRLSPAARSPYHDFTTSFSPFLISHSHFPVTDYRSCYNPPIDIRRRSSSAIPFPSDDTSSAHRCSLYVSTEQFHYWNNTYYFIIVNLNCLINISLLLSTYLSNIYIYI